MTESPMFRSRIDLAAPVREQVVNSLNQQLADTLDSYSQAKQAHWNVKRAEFFQLHELFDMPAEAVLGYVDPIAECVTAVGGTALGTVRMAATDSRLSDYPLAAVDRLQHVDAVAEPFAGYAATVRAAIDTDAALAMLIRPISSRRSRVVPTSIFGFWRRTSKDGSEIGLPSPQSLLWDGVS